MRVTLREVEPAVVRIVDVPADVSLPELHDLLQVTVGWTDSHLHEFASGDRVYGMPDEDAAEGQLDETGAKLAELGPLFVYRYDFGDGWEHDVEVLGTGEVDPGLRGGEGACPPEDCGGPCGYEELRRVMADPTDPEHAVTRDWVGGELRAFDAVGTDRLVRDTVGAVPESVRLVLDLVAAAPGAKVKLTPGGRLPRVFVREVQARRPGWYTWGPASIEDDLQPLVALHDLLRKAGLLRLSKGVLCATRAAGSGDLEIVRRVRKCFPVGAFETTLTEDCLALLAAGGPLRAEELAQRVYPILRGRWARGGRPLAVPDVLSSLWAQRSVWEGLDLVVTEGGVWHPGPSARSLLPTAAALAYLWSARQPAG